MPVPIRLLLAAAVLAGGAGRAGAVPTETVIPCETFKSGFARAVPAILPGRLAPAYVNEARPGTVRVANAADVEARLTCAEGTLSRVEIRQAAGDPAATLPPFLAFAAASLMGFNPDLTPLDANRLVAVMRAEARPGRDTVSAWGPYEITYAAGREGGRDEFTADYPEN